MSPTDIIDVADKLSLFKLKLRALEGAVSAMAAECSDRKLGDGVSYLCQSLADEGEEISDAMHKVLSVGKAA